MSDRSDRQAKMSTSPEQFKNECRKDSGPDLDFDRMEAALMSRVAAESSRRKLRSRLSLGIGALAMAAAAALVVARSHGIDPASDVSANGAARAAATVDIGAGQLESESVVSVSHLNASAGGASTAHVAHVAHDAHGLRRGESLHRGDEVETSRALFRASGRVVFAVSGDANAREATARVSVTETDRPIVLSLSRGIVEAQVDKVPSGEALAIDVPANTEDGSNSVRIAVHGTHLRVARTEGHVTLDLTEGIVNVGRPPKSGSTYGKLVTAPAHVEFDVASLETSFTMTKDVDKVRFAEDLSPATALADPLGPAALGLGGGGTQAVAPQLAPLAALAPPGLNTRPGQGLAQAPFTPLPRETAPKDPGMVPAPVEPRVDARTAINDAIALCALEKLRNEPGPASPTNAGGAAPSSKPGELTVTLASTLSLRVGDDGYVQAARFEPPLDPAVQKCAAGTIYKVHFTEPGSVMMPISLKTPSNPAAP